MVYKWYILPIGGLYATYHLVGEPETTIDTVHGLVLLLLVSGRVFLGGGDDVLRNQPTPPGQVPPFGFISV